MKRALAVLLVAVAACSSDGVSSSDPTSAATASDGSTSTGSGSSETTDAQTVTDPAGSTCWAAEPEAGDGGIAFADQTEAYGLIEPLTGMHGHSAAWGDLDDDGSLDLFVGTFADRDDDAYQYRGATGPSPDRLLRQAGGVFESVEIEEMRSRTSGAVMADADADGDLDVIVSRNFDDDTPDAPATMVLRNDGETFSPVPITGVPDGFGGRSIAVFDYNQDGLPDLFITEDRFTEGRSVLLENGSELSFVDVTGNAGIATDAHGLGVAVADLTGDGHAEILVAGSNRVFVATGDGTFQEAPGVLPEWEVYGEEDDVAGISVGDVNRDGLIDVLVGQHYNSTIEFGEKVPVRLYLNRGPDGDGMPVLEDVTEQAGLVGLPTKAPHVELNDLNNDGWPDVVTSASAADGSLPAVFSHMGVEDGVPRFSAPEGLGAEQYWVAGPTADIDQDGRLDMLLVEWEPSLPSLLLRNESGSGNWLEVSVDPDQAYGLGWRVEVYRGGELGDPAALLGTREITVAQGYSAGVAPIAHFGLGDQEVVDIRLIEPGFVSTHEIVGVSGNQHLRYPDGCG
jgi:hypothetical protein